MSRKGVHVKIDITVHGKNSLDIRVGNSEIRVAIVGAQYRLDAFSIMADPGYWAGHQLEEKQYRLKGELIECVNRANRYVPGDYSKTHFIIENHIAAIIEAMTKEVLLDEHVLGQTQAEVINFINLNKG